MKKNLFIWLCAGGLITGLSSCLDDKGYTDLIEAKGAQPIVSIFGGGSGSKTLGVDLSPTPVATQLFMVNLGSPQVLTQDVTATVSVNADLLKGTTLELLPTNTYTVASPQVTIKAGQRDVPFTVSFNTSLIDLKKTYALPLTITAANGAIIASNLKDVVYAIKVNNIYSGAYKSSGRFTHPVAESSRDINKDKSLATIDATTSETEFADLGGSGWTMLLKVNADNTVTLTPTGSASASAKQSGVNKYDPATKTFTLNYSYPGGGGDRVIREMIKKK